MADLLDCFYQWHLADELYRLMAWNQETSVIFSPGLTPTLLQRVTIPICIIAVPGGQAMSKPIL